MIPLNLVVATFFISALLTALLAVNFLASSARNPLCARVLGLNYGLFSLLNGLAVLVFSGVEGAGFVRASCAMLVGPALYAYFLSCLYPRRALAWSFVWHFIPAGLMVLVWWFEQWRFIEPMILASFVVYGVGVAWLLCRAPMDGAPISEVQVFARRWLWALVAIMVINIALELSVAIELRLGSTAIDSWSLRIGVCIFALFNGVTLLLVLMRASLIEWMHELKLPKAKKVAPSQAELQQLFIRWQQLVEERELYLAEQTITVTRAARLLGVSSRLLSQSINSEYGASFSQYLNDQRVERAKQLLTESPNMQITEVYLAAGFSTKSQFHREFTRVVAQTPSEYRIQFLGLP